MQPLLGKLAPTEYEALALPSGRQVFVGKCTPIFQPWNGGRERLGRTYDSKPLLELDGRRGNLLKKRLYSGSGISTEQFDDGGDYIE